MLTPCPECATEMSETANACPKCGWTHPNPALKIVGVILAILFGYLLISVLF